MSNTRPCNAGWLGKPIDEQGVSPSAKEAAQILQWEKTCSIPQAPGKAWWPAGCSSICSLRTFILRAVSQGIFSQWVRSRTPSGQPIDLINTRRANDDPGTRRIYRPPAGTRGDRA